MDVVAPAISSRKVRLLDPHTVNQIAAGEVVDRPASALKELIENAIDAGARRIEIDLSDSGRTLIRVADDGVGMAPEDARSALQRHATSKIATAGDLLGVRTLGFRGEALPSIASVSRMTLSTAEADGARFRLRVADSQIEEIESEPGPRGTEILVEDLFYNTPARLKFLKSDTTELGACLEVVSRYAIGYPEIAFLFRHNGQIGAQTPGDGDMLEAIACVWGREMARSLAEVRSANSEMTVSGFVSPPHVTKHARTYQYVWVNGRPVKTRTLTAALDQAYRDLTPEKRYPILALKIDIDPDRIDVNVSPTKSEVKFQREGAAFEALRTGIKSALMEHGMMPSAEQVLLANEALAGVRAPTYPSHPGMAVFEASIAAQAPLSVSNAGPLEAPFEAPMPFSGASPAPILHGERFPYGDLLEGLRVIGQAMNTFILAETARGIVIVDQHVAHERILYEYLCGIRGASAIEKQALLVPATLNLDKRSAILFRDRIDEVRAVGFDLEPFGGDSYLIRSAPAAIKGKDPAKVLAEMIDELVESSVTRRLSPTREQIWITTSCKMAVKSGDPLSMAEMERLLVDLASTENPYLCPHGRPITLTLGKDELMRKFKRA